VWHIRNHHRVTDASGHYLFDHLPAPTGGRNYTAPVLSGVASVSPRRLIRTASKDGTSSVTLTARPPVNLNQDFGFRCR